MSFLVSHDGWLNDYRHLWALADENGEMAYTSMFYPPMIISCFLSRDS